MHIFGYVHICITIYIYTYVCSPDIAFVAIQVLNGDVVLHDPFAKAACEKHRSFACTCISCMSHKVPESCLGILNVTHAYIYGYIYIYTYVYSPAAPSSTMVLWPTLSPLEVCLNAAHGGSLRHVLILDAQVWRMQIRPGERPVVLPPLLWLILLELLSTTYCTLLPT